VNRHGELGAIGRKPRLPECAGLDLEGLLRAVGGHPHEPAALSGALRYEDEEPVVADVESREPGVRSSGDALEQSNRGSRHLQPFPIEGHGVEKVRTTIDEVPRGRVFRGEAVVDQNAPAPRPRRQDFDLESIAAPMKRVDDRLSAGNDLRIVDVDLALVGLDGPHLLRLPPSEETRNSPPS
jgi:hypothetical protein